MAGIAAAASWVDPHVPYSEVFDNTGNNQPQNYTTAAASTYHQAGVQFAAGGGCATWEGCNPTCGYGLAMHYFAPHTVTVPAGKKWESRAHLKATHNFASCGFIMGQWQCVGGQYAYNDREWEGVRLED